MPMDWAEAKEYWTALGYSQATFSRKLQSSPLGGTMGFSPSRLSRRANAREPVPEPIEAWLRALPPRAGHKARFEKWLAAKAAQKKAGGSRSDENQWHPPATRVITSGLLALLVLLWINLSDSAEWALRQVREISAAPLPALTPLPARAMGPSRATGFSVPAQPLPGQARPPCPSPADKIIHGGCWIGPVQGEEAPCSTGRFEHDGVCYVFQPELRPESPPSRPVPSERGP